MRTKIRQKLFSVQFNVFLHQCITKWRQTSLVQIQAAFIANHCTVQYCGINICVLLIAWEHFLHKFRTSGAAHSY